MIGRFVEPVEDVYAGNIVGLVRDGNESKLLATLATCGIHRASRRRLLIAVGKSWVFEFLREIRQKWDVWRNRL
jgi:hypothetical protein